MAEEARRRAGKGTGQGGSESSHPFKGKGKGCGKAQQKGGKGKSGPGGGPATPSAVRMDPLLEAAYQLYIAGRRADQPRVSRNAWFRNNICVPTPPSERSSESACGQLTTRPRLAPSRPRPRRVSRSRPLPVSRRSCPCAGGELHLKLLLGTAGSPSRPDPLVQKDARKTTSAKSAANAQHYTRAPVEPAHWEPAEMEAGAVSPASQALSEWDWPEPIKEEVEATPQEGFSMGSMVTALQQASEEKPECASPPDNPASPSRSEPQLETVESPTSPAVVEVCTETSQAPLQAPRWWAPHLWPTSGPQNRFLQNGVTCLSLQAPLQAAPTTWRKARAPPLRHRDRRPMQQESPSRRWLPWARRQWEPRAPRGAARLSSLSARSK